MLSSLWVKGQHEQHDISGTVTYTIGDKIRPIAGAFVHWQENPSGVYADSTGHFKIEHHHEAPYLIASFASYKSDTIYVKDLTRPVVFTLKDQNELQGATVFAKKLSYSLSKLDPRTTILMDEREFQKAACCNLSESFENSPAIDASFADAVTGTKQIKMLGLDGFYTLIG